MPPSQVDLLTRETVFRGYLRVDALTLRHELFEGGMGPTVRREIIERGHAVAVLPYDPVADRVVLLEQFRPAVWSSGEPAWMIEVVAGIIDGDETPEEVARRECQEECGLLPTALEPIGRVFVSPGVLTETVTLYCGRVDSTGAGGIHGLIAEGEDIRVFTLGADEMRAWTEAGRFTNATALIAAQWFALHRDALRQRWGQER
ncbi:NUDIX domain-containing protein [Pararhodospirillum oryzae]|uniref:ADP-ribose pyrophosphatase n=1 Tax=Pararhodospirillum oryzae TaxID=478448 RepID=A0A512H5D4_9PROT|nr:NUDIX domain-containing protein [Pararhodospirillum oryzae]GEO80643.1 nucleoside diphosphate pyrophosphatase [Pararhodospirillum oryzae]